MLAGVVTVIAFIAAAVILPRYVFGGRRRGSGRVKVRYGPSLIGSASIGIAQIFVRYWMYTFPVTFAAIITLIGFLLI